MCVIKEVDLGPLTPRERQEAWSETRILQSLEPYPNVINYVEAHIDHEGEKLNLVIEYADNGDLATQVLYRKTLLDEQKNAHEASRGALPGNQCNCCEKSPFFQEQDIMLVFVQCLFGLHHLHKNSIMHRDIKTQNILLFSNGLVKLGDFGVAKSFKRTKIRKSYVGSPLYMAPEIHSSQGYTYKADIWSLGCVLHELCCLKHPYTGNNIIQLAMEVTSAPPPTCLDVPPRTYAVDLLHLINRMLQKDPDLRPSTPELIRMPFVFKYSELLASRYKVLRHFKQIHVEFKETLCELPPASPCLQAANMRGQGIHIKTVTEEELFAFGDEAIPTGMTDLNHNQERGESPEGHFAPSAKCEDPHYGTKCSEGADAAVEASAAFPWKSPSTIETHTVVERQLDNRWLLIPESPLKPARLQSCHNASLGDRELLFLLDALIPHADPVTGGNTITPREQLSQSGSATENILTVEQLPSLPIVAAQAAWKVHEGSELASNQYAHEAQQDLTAEAHFTQPVSNVASMDASGAPLRNTSEVISCATRQNRQPRYWAKTACPACASIPARPGVTGHRKAKRFWRNSCCRRGSERKDCGRVRKEGDIHESV